MTVDPAATPLQTAVIEYFAGERQELWLTLGAMVVVSGLAFWLWFATRSGFALALAVTTAAASMLFAGGAASLLTRDARLSGTLLQALGTKSEPAAVATERERIAVVRSKYRYYRWGAGVLALLAAMGLVFTNRAWVHGLAAGLLLLVVAQALIDHYSERRADHYFERLVRGAG